MLTQVFRPKLPDAEALLPYLRAIDAERIYTNLGPLNALLASRLNAHLGLPHASTVLTSSGTSALCGALLAARGRRCMRRLALVPSLTFVATAVAAQRCGFEPLIVDVDEDSWMLDPDRLSDHPLLDQIGIVVPVACYGRPVAQRPWARFVARTGIPVVIDGAASFSTIEADPAAYIGDVPVALSFHATKSFGVGEGGAVLCTDPQTNAAVACAINFGFFGSRDSVAPSCNGKMSEFHAAVGLAALEAWPERRRAIAGVAERYRQRFGSSGSNSFRLHAAPAIDGGYVLLECQGDAALGVQRALTEADAGTRFWYGRGLWAHPHFADSLRDPTPVADALSARLLGLPASHDLEPDEIERVVAVAHRALGATMPSAA